MLTNRLYIYIFFVKEKLKKSDDSILTNKKFYNNSFND